MARLPIMSREHVQDFDVLLGPWVSQFGFPANALLAMAHVPDILRAYINLSNAVLHVDRGIPRTLKWMVAHVASRSAGCTYWAVHALRNAMMVGGSTYDEQRIAAIRDFARSMQFTEAEKAAMHVAWGAGAVPNSVTDEDFDRLKTYFGTREIVEILAVVALCGFLSRWTETLKVELEPPVLEFAARHGLEAYDLFSAQHPMQETAGQGAVW
jgi:alkylhydroperoxidase family enzyme